MCTEVKQGKDNPRIDDFEKSPLRFEMEALLEEYRTLRSEIIIRLTSQQQIINFTITLIAAIIAVGQLLPDLENRLGSTQSLRFAYLFISLLFSAFSLMYLEHDAMIASLAIYIMIRLRPRMQEILSQIPEVQPIIWQWDDFRGDIQIRSIKAVPFFSLMSVSRYAIMVVPSIIMLVLYWLDRANYGYTSIWENMLFVFVSFALIWVFATAIFVARMYLGSPESSSVPKPVTPNGFWRTILRKRKCIILGLLFSAYLFLGVAIATRREPAVRFAQVDFNTYYAAATLFVRGQNIYDGKLLGNLIRNLGLEYIDGSNYIYPPYLAMFLIPLTFLPPLSAGFVWYIINLVALCLATWFIASSGLHPETSTSQKSQWCDFMILSLIFVPTTYSFYVGQVNAILLLLLAGTYFFLEKDREIMAGVMLGTSILIKVAPAIMMVYLIIKRKRTAFISALSTVIATILITAPAVYTCLMAYPTVMIQKLSTAVPHPVNQSINGFFSRLFTETQFTVPLWNAPELVNIFTWISSLVILIIVTISMMVASRKYVQKASDDLLFGQLVTVMVVISPLAWENFYLLLVFPILAIFRRWNTLSRSQRYLFVTSFLLITAQRLWDPFVNSPTDFPALRHFPLLMSLGLYGALILLFLKIQVVARHDDFYYNIRT